jgi:hypothetical protein
VFCFHPNSSEILEFSTKTACGVIFSDFPYPIADLRKLKNNKAQSSGMLPNKSGKHWQMPPDNQFLLMAVEFKKNTVE